MLNVIDGCVCVCVCVCVGARGALSFVVVFRSMLTLSHPQPPRTLNPLGLRSSWLHLHDAVYTYRLALCVHSVNQLELHVQGSVSLTLPLVTLVTRRG